MDLKINNKGMQLTISMMHCNYKFYQRTQHEITLKLVEKIFYSNFVENGNIEDINVLRNITVSCGLEEYEVNKILKNEYYSIKVYLDIEKAVSHGISATPYFILNNKEERPIIPSVFSAEEFETTLKDMIDEKIEEKTLGVESVQ